MTLELALAQVPTVAAYRGAAWEAAIARRLIKLPTVILANLVVGRSVVPEFIQDDGDGRGPEPEPAGGARRGAGAAAPA